MYEVSSRRKKTGKDKEYGRIFSPSILRHGKYAYRLAPACKMPCAIRTKQRLFFTAPADQL